MSPDALEYGETTSHRTGNLLQTPVVGCEHRKFRLLFVLEQPAAWKPTGSVLSELSAVNARLFAFARRMAQRGHRVQVADVERLSQVRQRPALSDLSCGLQP